MILRDDLLRVSSHDGPGYVPVVDFGAWRVALMNRGQLLGVDDPNVLRESFPHLVIELVARPRRPAASRSTFN